MASMNLLIDADLLLYRTTAVTEREVDWGDDVSTIHCDHKEMAAIADRTVDNLVKELELTNYKIILVFSGWANFRKELCSDYKANRQGRKPVGYTILKDYLQKTYDWKCIGNIEADDLLGIMQTSGKYPKSMIVSDDKDMLQVPGKLYIPGKGTYRDVTDEEAEYHHLFQTLCGDRADNYPGLPGCGDKTAEKILTEGGWDAVVKAFVDKGLTEEDALLQARLAKILHFKDYDFKKGKPKLWTPTSKVSASSVAVKSTTPATPNTSAEPSAASSPSKKVRGTKKKQSTDPTTTQSGRSSRSRSSSKTNSRTASVTSSSTS